MSWQRNVWVISALLILAGCGFEPVYGNREGVPQTNRAVLSNIAVSDISGREGQILKIALEDALNPASASGANRYTLNSTLKRTVIPGVIGSDASIQRYSVLVEAEFSLTEAGKSEPVYRGTAKRYGSYSRSESDFSTFVADSDVTRQTIEALAGDIVMRISSLNLTRAP